MKTVPIDVGSISCQTICLIREMKVGAIPGSNPLILRCETEALWVRANGCCRATDYVDKKKIILNFVDGQLVSPGGWDCQAFVNLDYFLARLKALAESASLKAATLTS